MKKYFTGIKTKQELRKAYIKLAKANHPDNGGDVEIFKAIQCEYEKLIKILPDKVAETEQEKEQAKADERELDEAIKEMIDKIIILDGLNIEIVGSWIWVDGNTYSHREELKENGFKWSKSRKKWYFTPYASTTRCRGSKKSFEELRNEYGSDAMKSKGVEKIA